MASIRFVFSSAFVTLTRRLYSTAIHYTFKGDVWNYLSNPLPPTLNYYGIPMVSIYSSDFVETVIQNIKTIINSSNHESPYFNFIIEVLLNSGQVRTVGTGFIVERSTDMTKLAQQLTAYIEAFETQSGTAAAIATLVLFLNCSNSFVSMLSPFVFKTFS